MTRRTELSSTPAPANRIRTGVAVVVFGLLSVTRLCAEAAIMSYPTLTLKDGRQFVAVQIVNYTSKGVLVRHAKGATTFRLEVLPDAVIAALHLQGWEAEAALARTVDMSLADKPAVADPSLPAVAERPAVAVVIAAADIADRPAIAVAAPGKVVHFDPTADREAAPAVVAEAKPIAPPAPKANATEAAYTDLPGRVVVTLPAAGTHFLGDVEVRAYPADLLATYLVQAKAQARDEAQRLTAQASAAAAEGRTADYTALAARAEKAPGRYLDYLPEAPVVARSDEFGNFTLHHKLRNLRIVAAGRVNGGQGEWSFEWVGITPEKDAHLTETNATNVIVPAVTARGNASKYASR